MKKSSEEWFKIFTMRVASIGFGSGLNKEERELMEQSGMGQSNKLRAQFTGGIHVKVY